MRLSFLIIIITFGLTVFSQQDTIHEINNIIKINPLKIIDLANPAIELAYERKTGRKFSTQIMASFLLPSSIMDTKQVPPENNQGFRLAIEEKYYFQKFAPSGFYFSIELDFLTTEYNEVWNFGVENIYSDTLFLYTNNSDTFSIKKQTYSLNLKLGYQLIIKRISIDFYAGIGLRYKDVTHYDRTNPNDAMERPRHPNFYYYKNIEGQYWTISIPLNVRIGYTF